MKRLKAAYISQGADATMLLQEAKNPSQYGVVVGDELIAGLVRIRGAIEKPENFMSSIAIMPVYILMNRRSRHWISFSLEGEARFCLQMLFSRLFGLGKL